MISIRHIVNCRMLSQTHRFAQRLRTQRVIRRRALALVLALEAVGATLLNSAYAAETEPSAKVTSPVSPKGQQLDRSTSTAAPAIPATMAASSVISATNEQLADAFMLSLGKGTSSPQVVTKWNSPIYLGLSIRDKGVPAATEYAETMPTELDGIVREKIENFKKLLKVQILWPTPGTSTNFELALYGRRKAVDRWVVNLPRWFIALYPVHSERAPPDVLQNIVYGGVAVSRISGSAIDRGGCSATYHLQKHYRLELLARQLLAAGSSKDEVSRSMRDLQKSGNAAVRQRLAENDAKFPLGSACSRSDYMDRWGKIIDACFAAMLGLHPAPAIDAPRDLVWNNQWSVVELGYRSAGYSVYERYWPLFLQILYSDALPAGTKFTDAREVALREIEARRPAFEAQLTPTRASCTGVP